MSVCVCVCVCVFVCVYVCVCVHACVHVCVDAVMTRLPHTPHRTWNNILAPSICNRQHHCFLCHYRIPARPAAGHS